jgi:hypothetical protein
MTDQPRYDTPQPVEARHTLTVREVEALFADAGVQRSHRHVLRLCQSGMLDAVKIPGGPSGEEWYVAPASVPKAVGDLKQIDAQRSRRGTTQPAVTALPQSDLKPTLPTDKPGHVPPERATSPSEDKPSNVETHPVMSRHGVTDRDIYDHPYVKKLEQRCERLEQKYEAQVRRTEEIQIKSQERLLELQRMTAVGQSRTLAEFMLNAKNWVLGSNNDATSSDISEQSAP